MNRSPRYLIVLAALVALLCGAGAGLALASPDGDDDPAFNPSGADGFGTQYSLLTADGSAYGRPVVTQAPDGASVSATLMRGSSTIKLTRLDGSGTPAGLGGSGTVQVYLPPGYEQTYNDLLDIRVVGGQIVVLARVTEDGFLGQYLAVLRFDYATGVFDSDDDLQKFDQPEDCQASASQRGQRDQKAGILEAARTTAAGGVYGLWTCYDPDDLRQDVRTGGDRTAYPYGRQAEGDIYVAEYDASDDSGEVDSQRVDDGAEADYGEDLELGPNGDPFVLTGWYGSAGDRSRGRLIAVEASRVYHLSDGEGGLHYVGESDYVPGLPVDLAVDHQGRPLVWSRALKRERGAATSGWVISRLTAELDPDDTWGDGGTTEVTDSRLGDPFGTNSFCGQTKNSYLTVRPDNRVLATGPAANTSGGDTPACRQYDRAANAYSGEAIVVGLTTAGQVDTGFASSGFKAFTYPGSGSGGEAGATSATGFWAVGEPAIQSDGKILVPHTTYRENSEPDTTTGTTVTVKSASPRAGHLRVTPPPASSADTAFYLGVTRLNPDPASAGVGHVRPIGASGVPAICGRRAISLVRADVRGRKVRLTGLVGSAFYGKKVTVQTDPKGAKASGFSRTATVTASKSTGSFSVSVPRPKTSSFKSVRYRATVGRAKSPALKLPQSLTSRTVKSTKGTITIRGRVKKSVLGRRNKVKIRRLACGRYRTVGTARPDRDGNYSVTFKATALRGVSFYRAEAVVQVRPGSKKYAIQYARAIAIKTTSQTG